MNIKPTQKQEEFIESVFDYKSGYTFDKGSFCDLVGEEVYDNLQEPLARKYEVKDGDIIEELVDVSQEVIDLYGLTAVGLDRCVIQSNNIFVYGGGFGGGKTYGALIIMMILARAYKGSKWIVLRESMPSLKRTVHETWTKIFPRGFFKKTQSMPDIIYEGKNGSQIIFMSENFSKDPDLDRFKSLEFNGAFLEQIEEIQKETFDMVLMRAGRWDVPSKPPRVVLCSVNPTPLWPREFFYDKHIEETLPKGTKFIEALLVDNPHLLRNQEFMKSLEEMPPLVRDRFVKGDWDAFKKGDVWAQSFESLLHVSDKAVLNEKDFIYLSFDFNVSPMTCGVHQHGLLDGEEYIHRIDEFHQNDSNIYKLCKAIKEKYGSILMRVTGDSSGKNRQSADAETRNYYQIIRQELELPKTHMKAPDSNFRLKASRALVNAVFFKHPNFLINPCCVETVKDLKYCLAMPDDTIDKGKDARRTHQLDNVRYYLETFHSRFIRRFKYAS